MAIAPTLMSRYNFQMYLRDIFQTYIQSKTKLERDIVAWLPKEMANKLPQGTVMVIIQPLYGIAESGNHWWSIYYKHYLENLTIEASTFDPCLLIT